MVKEFTDFPDLGPTQVGDKFVGTRNNQNIQMDLDTGVLDTYGNYLFGWLTSGTLSSNYFKVLNNMSGLPPTLTTEGADTNIDMLLSPKGEGSVTSETTGAGSFTHSSLGTGGFTVNTGGYLNFNSTQPFTGVTNDGALATASTRLLPTEFAVKTYVDTADTEVKSYSYITKTDNTANLPNSIPLSGIATGFLSNTTATGVLNPRTITGTANQVEITNGSGVSGDPTAALSSTLIFPGTISFGGSSATVNDIDNTGTSFLSTELITGLGTQLAIANAIDAGVSFRGGWDASGGTYPTTGGTGAAGAVEAGNWWYITTAGTLSGQDVSIGDWITALVNAPGQTGSNWLISAQGVNKVFDRIGNVVAERGDYSVDKITNGYNNDVSWVFSDFTAAVPPTLDTDATLGYTVGSLYTDTLTGYSYVCKDAGEGAAIWEKMAPTNASYADNVFSLNVNGNAADTEIVPLSPSGATYVAENGDDVTGRINSPAFPFYTLPAGINALNAVLDKIGNVLLVYPRGDGTLYENASIAGFSGWEIRGVGNNVIASDFLISDNATSAFVGGGRVANIYFNNLSISNFNDNIDGTTFEIGAFNDYVIDNEPSATNGLNSGNTFIDVEFVGSTIYFPSGYSRQINSITEKYIGCKFSGTMTINGTATQIRFIACQNTPAIVYANGATSAQVTIIGANSSNSYARIWTGAASGNTLSFSITPVEVRGLSTPFTLESSSKDFAMTTDGRLTYTGSDTKKFMCWCTTSVNNSANGAVQLYKNGSPIAGAIARGTMYGNIGVAGTIVSLATNDYLSTFVNFLAGAASPTVFISQISVQSVD